MPYVIHCPPKVHSHKIFLRMFYDRDTFCYDYDHPKKIFIILTHLTVLQNAEVKFLKSEVICDFFIILIIETSVLTFK